MQPDDRDRFAVTGMKDGQLIESEAFHDARAHAHELRLLAASIYPSVSEALQVHNRNLAPGLRDPLIARAVEESVLAAEKILQVTSQRLSIVPSTRGIPTTMTPPRVVGGGNGRTVVEAVEEHERRLREEP